MALFALVFKYIYQFQSLSVKVLTLLKVELVACGEFIRSLENVVSSFPNRNYRERKDFDGTCMYFVILTGAK